jgi:hypothetical protein
VRAPRALGPWTSPPFPDLMNAFATRIVIDSAPSSRTTDTVTVPHEPAPSRWARFRRAVAERDTRARATPK